MKSEEELLKLLQNGEEEAVKVVFDRYYDGLCLYAESIIRDHHVAEEIVEDLFIHLWINHQFKTFHSSIKNYLFRSIHNNCLKYLSKLKTEKKLQGDLHYMLDDPEILQPLTSEYPISNLIAQELEAKAEKILELLPDHCRKIYMLNRFENLSYSEIAVKLNISVGTVKTQMSRAFERFREELKEYMPLIIIVILFN